MQHSTDSRGRLFLDRDPSLFAVLLQFLRAGTLPNQLYINAHREALLEECKFFQIVHLEDRLRGHTSVYDLRLQDRVIKKNEKLTRDSLGDASFLIDVFSTDTSPLDPILLELPLLDSNTARIAVNCDYATFCSRYNTLTNDLASKIAELPGIVFAGGSVVGTLIQGSVGDWEEGNM